AVAFPQRQVARRPAPLRADGVVALEAFEEGVGDKGVVAVLEGVPGGGRHVDEAIEDVDLGQESSSSIVRIHIVGAASAASFLFNDAVPSGKSSRLKP